MPPVATPLAGFRVIADRVAGRLAAEYATHGPGRQPWLQTIVMANHDQLSHSAGVPAQVGFGHDVDDKARPGRRYRRQILARVVGVAVAEIAHSETGAGCVSHRKAPATRPACGR